MKFRSLTNKPLGLAMLAMCSGAVARYAVGTGWYWNAIGQLPGPIAAWMEAAVDRARPLLAEDTTVAEEQAELYLAWLLFFGIAILGLITAATFRPIWLARTARTL